MEPQSIEEFERLLELQRKQLEMINEMTERQSQHVFHLLEGATKMISNLKQMKIELGESEEETEQDNNPMGFDPELRLDV